MTFYDFYDALDNELNEVIAENPQDVRLHKGDESTRKSFAFLIWFMKFYGKRPIYNLNITEGDDDTSCDIIFSTFDNVGKKIVYVIQSKWKSRKNCTEKLDSTAFKATLDDFKLVYSGQKQFSSNNENFNKQYEVLKQHLAENQYVKFVYLTLCQTNPSVSENVELFKKQYADLEIIDIERLRRDFIETRYKEFKPENPLEYDYNPEVEAITILIEQLEIEKNYLRVDAPFNSYTFLIRPKTIYELFEKYGFKLFFSNIRNPLIASDYNKQIEQTMLDAPSYFWYFNNGITAITRDLPKRINATAQQIEITGLQIINGAQTVYSVYKAYRDAKNGKRDTLNKALLQLRLVQSINKEFDLDITRYTNQQNPTEPRDFWANDRVQIRLQNESFATNYWYEIRRGEFRSIPSKVKVISNKEFMRLYSEFKGVSIDIENSLWISQKVSYNFFEGEYEKHFIDSIKFEDLLVAFRINEELNVFFEFLNDSDSKFKFNIFHHYQRAPSQVNLDHEYNFLHEINIVLSKIFINDFNKRVLNKLEKDSNFLYKVVAFIDQLRLNFIKENPDLLEYANMLKVGSMLNKEIVTEQEINEIDWEKYFDFDFKTYIPSFFTINH